MDENETKKIKQIIANLEFATEKLNDLNSHFAQSPQLYDFKRFRSAMTLIKDAKTEAYKLIGEA